MSGPFQVRPLPQGEGWVMVGDFSRDIADGAHVAGMFPARYAAEAQEFADRLNIRELAGRS